MKPAGLVAFYVLRRDACITVLDFFLFLHIGDGFNCCAQCTFKKYTIM